MGSGRVCAREALDASRAAPGDLGAQRAWAQAHGLSWVEFQELACAALAADRELMSPQERCREWPGESRG